MVDEAQAPRGGTLRWRLGLADQHGANGNRGPRLQYKKLPWLVEHWFRSCKTLLETRPIYHRCDETIRGHVFCSFLALLLRYELQAAAGGAAVSPLRVGQM